ncbi:MAG: hypothetical protein AAGF59_07230 [Pseudomonadota bacterium]
MAFQAVAIIIRGDLWWAGNTMFTTFASDFPPVLIAFDYRERRFRAD